MGGQQWPCPDQHAKAEGGLCRQLLRRFAQRGQGSITEGRILCPRQVVKFSIEGLDKVDRKKLENKDDFQRLRDWHPVALPGGERASEDFPGHGKT